MRVQRGGGCEWPGWQQYKQYYISPQGRVIDPSSPNKITTSEGQSYGLFFPGGQRPADLRSAVGWTENNGGGRSQRPFARGCGARATTSSGRCWTPIRRRMPICGSLTTCSKPAACGKPALSNPGTLLLQRIGREEVADIPGPA